MIGFQCGKEEFRSLAIKYVATGYRDPKIVLVVSAIIEQAVGGEQYLSVKASRIRNVKEKGM